MTKEKLKERTKMTGQRKRWIDEIKIEGARMLYKHFSGEKDSFHAHGQRDFSVIIEDLEYANSLIKEGWNIKFPEPNPDIAPEDDTRRPYLKVKVAFDNVPPKVYTISENANGEQVRLEINESNVIMLDTLRFSHIDMVIIPYQWTHNGESGVSAYLSQFYGTIEPRGFEDKYGF